MLSCTAKLKRKGRAICRYCKKRHQSGHELTAHLRKGCPKKPAKRQDNPRLWKPEIKAVFSPFQPIPSDEYVLDFGLPESPPPPGLVKIDLGSGSYIYGLPPPKSLPKFKPKAILQRPKPPAPLPPTLADIIQAIKEAIPPPEPIQLVSQDLEFISNTITWSLDQSNLYLQDSLAEASADQKSWLADQKSWLARKFNDIPEATDWDMDLLLKREREHTRQLLDEAVRELKTFIRERTPPPAYQA
jgi:hypothetical protein